MRCSQLSNALLSIARKALLSLLPAADYEGAYRQVWGLRGQHRRYNFWGVYLTRSNVVDLVNLWQCVVISVHLHAQSVGCAPPNISHSTQVHHHHHHYHPGDSFQVAFPTVGAAVQWCMEVQRALLETVWPRRVTRLPSCSREVDIQVLLKQVG